MSDFYNSRLRRYSRHLYEILRYKFLDHELSPIRFVIFGRGRSGSTALVSMLDNVPNVYCDGEILNKRVLFPYTHVMAKCGNSGASIYGCKILSYQINKVQPIINRKEFLQRLYRNGFKIIYLKRENLLYHALSNLRAREFGFHKKKSEKLSHNKIVVDLDKLISWIKGSEESDRYEAMLLKGIPHLSLTYEKHLANSEDHQSTLELVCDFIEVKSGDSKTEFRKVSPGSLRDSIANYEDVVKFLADTPYAKYLD